MLSSSSSPYYNTSYPTEQSNDTKGSSASNSSSYYPASAPALTTATKIPHPPPDDQEAPPPSSSNTYHLTQSGNSHWDLPPGWKIAHTEQDGRMYYFELSTGQTRWSHPLAPTAPSTTSPINGHGTNVINGQPYYETPLTASRRPDSHQCLALFACVLFPPLGIFALIHSILTYRAWSKGRYGDAYDHSRQAYNFSWWSICIIVVWSIYRYFWVGDWKFNWDFFGIFD